MLGLVRSAMTKVLDAAKRAERLCKMRPYPSEERQLIRDMRLALEGLIDEVSA
jgi:hypothetical protein